MEVCHWQKFWVCGKMNFSSMNRAKKDYDVYFHHSTMGTIFEKRVKQANLRFIFLLLWGRDRLYPGNGNTFSYIGSQRNEQLTRSSRGIKTSIRCVSDRHVCEKLARKYSVKKNCTRCQTQEKWWSASIIAVNWTSFLVHVANRIFLIPSTRL